MAIDYNKINEYLNLTSEIESTLVDHKELFDSEKLIEFKKITSALEQNLKLAKEDSRKLSIGIVGSVKAGKSSFLNACVFKGEDYLPKAATPMTAALTKITYSEKPKAIIHFYTSEDWDRIEELSDLYDKALDKDYDEYCQRKRRHNTLSKKRDTTSTDTQPESREEYATDTQLESKEEYEKKFKCKYKSNEQKGAKELTRMAEDPALLDKLGSADEIDGDIIHKLNDYVGANGRYTPIVSYVELQVDNPYIKDYEIVDTPGLNDPIVSRGNKTKDFLRSCDVVLLLSPCSQFMDSKTVTLMSNSLPSSGVREILVIGSKLDSGILNENDNEFRLAYKKAIRSYKSQFCKNLNEVKRSGKHKEILDKMSPETVLFISSTCFAINQKIKNTIPFDENERTVYHNLHGRFNDFKDEYLSNLSGINDVKRALNGVSGRKKDIIEGKSSSLLDNTRISHLRILDNILQETVSSRTKLETISAEDLKQRTINIRDVIDSSRNKLIHIFDNAAINCDKKVQQILPQLTIELEQHKRIAVDKTLHTEHKTLKIGLFGWFKEEIPISVVDHTADTSEVINNIKMCSSKWHAFVNNEFKNIFDKERFSQDIKNVILNAFSKSQKGFDEDDILLPLQNVLDRISIPHISFDYTPYIDVIETSFKSGFAKNEEIHRLSVLQTKLLNQIQVDISKQLCDALEDITKTLKTQAVLFADQIENEFCGELEKLQGQVEEKERYIEEYREFAQILKDLKAKVSI